MGVLKVRVDGKWEPIGGADEVAVGPDDPLVDDPAIELWYDTDAVATLGPGEIPKGGLTHQALTKRTDQDGEVEWSGPHLKLAGGTLTGPVDTDANAPITANAPVVTNAALTANDPVTVNAPVTINEQLNMGSGDKIQFPNVTGPKILLYAATFGIGVESGEISLFGSSKVGFRTNASNGAYFGYVDANTGGGLIIDRDNCDARYAPIADRYTAGDINGVAVTAGQYYFVGTVGSQGACRFSVLARVSGGRAHAVSGVATKGTSSGSGDATFTISGNTNAYGKIFDYICVGPNNSYGIFIRSVYTGTIDVGIEFVNSDGNTVPGNFAQGSYGSIDYGGAGL